MISRVEHDGLWTGWRISNWSEWVGKKNAECRFVEAEAALLDKACWCVWARSRLSVTFFFVFAFAYCGEIILHLVKPFGERLSFGSAYVGGLVALLYFNGPLPFGDTTRRS